LTWPTRGPAVSMTSKGPAADSRKRSIIMGLLGDCAADRTAGLGWDEKQQDVFACYMRSLSPCHWGCPCGGPDVWRKPSHGQHQLPHGARTTA
jgi:hypothetical protein